MSKRESPPPFEIMRVGSKPAASGPTSGRDEPSGWPGWLDWASGLRRPVVMRLPMGLMIVVLVGLLLVVMLAYWVGQQMGQAAARAELNEAQRVLPTSGGRGGTGGLISVDGQPIGGGNSATNGGTNGADPGSSSMDPRVIGMNYLILARYPREEALRLVGFLREHGVASMVVPTDNAGLYLVVDRQGFTPEQVRNEAYEQRKQELKRLGRLWKSARDGPTDLSDLYGQKYRG